MSTTLIERLNEIVATGEVSRAGLARAAGLHPNSLRKLGSSDWNPTADTLSRLEKLIQRGTAEVLVGTEAIINEARNGRMFILVDDESRENEGDVVIPAQMATPDAVNFMARHGRGRGARPCRPYRGGGGRLAARRPQSERGDLRDHVRRWLDGADERPYGFRPHPWAEDRHHPRPDRVPAEEGPSGREGRDHTLHR